MDTIKFSILIPLLCLCISCEKEQPLEKEVYPEDCAGYSAAIYKVGYAHAEGSYQDFGDYAIFVRDRMADTVNGGWMHDPVEKGIILTSINESCSERMKIIIPNIKLIIYRYDINQVFKSWFIKRLSDCRYALLGC